MSTWTRATFDTSEIWHHVNHASQMVGHDHGRRSVGDGGVASPHFSAWGDSIGNVSPTTFSRKTKQIYRHIARLITPLS